MTEFTCDLLAAMIRNLPGRLQYWQQRCEDASETTTNDKRQMDGFLVPAHMKKKKKNLFITNKHTHQTSDQCMLVMGCRKSNSHLCRPPMLQL